MAKRKRASRRSGLVGRAVSAGRKALKEAESRIPADLRRQVERRVRDASKTVQAAIKDGQAQVKKASTRSDVNSFLKRLDGLTKQAKQLARGRSTAKRSTARRATGAARQAKPTVKRAPRKAAPKRPAARADASPATPARGNRPRRRARRTTPAVTETTSHPTETPAEVGETPSMGQSRP